MKKEKIEKIENILCCIYTQVFGLLFVVSLLTSLEFNSGVPLLVFLFNFVLFVFWVCKD